MGTGLGGWRLALLKRSLGLFWSILRARLLAGADLGSLLRRAWYTGVLFCLSWISAVLGCALVTRCALSFSALRSAARPALGWVGGGLLAALGVARGTRHSARAVFLCFGRRPLLGSASVPPTKQLN